jgi:hypothetical protein
MNRVPTIKNAAPVLVAMLGLLMVTPALATLPGTCRLLSSSGQPVANTTVWQVNADPLELRNGYAYDPDEGRRTHTKKFVTDQDGFFTMPKADDCCVLFAETEEGYAQVKVSRAYPATIRIKPWARVEGRVWKGDRPATKEKIMLTPMIHDDAGLDREQTGHVEWIHETVTDEEGRYSFERVPEGDVGIWVWVEYGNISKAHLKKTTFVRAGGSATIETQRP